MIFIFITTLAGSNVKARTPLGLHALSIYQHLIDHGYAQKDFSSVYDFIKKT